MATESRFDAANGTAVWLAKLTNASGTDLAEIAEYITGLEVENDRARREAVELRRRLAEREGVAE